MLRKISFINYKGGVGKTSIVVNIAACLADDGHKVLVVDCDPQSNASIWLMRLDRWNPINNTPQSTLMGLIQNKEQCIRDVIISDVVKDNDGQSILPGLDLLPTTFHLMDLDSLDAENSDNPSYQIFEDKLKSEYAKYDYILFDCPPGMYSPSKCALYCSDEIIVPANPDALSLIGFSLLTRKRHEFINSLDSPENKAAIKGIVLNAIKSNSNIEIPVQRMKLQINRFQQHGLLPPETKIFDTRIHDAIGVSRATMKGLPVIKISSRYCNPTARMDYRNFSEEIINMTKDDAPES